MTEHEWVNGVGRDVGGVSWFFWSCGASVGFLTRYDRELREPLLWRQGSQVSMRVFKYNAATAKSLQSCPILCDPRDGSPSGSPVPGILQARTLEWVAISFSNA